MPISFEQFLSKTKISEITTQAYKQDIDSFLNLIYKKNKNLNQINQTDFNEYIDCLKKDCLSTAYALRKLGTLKLFFKFLTQEYELKDYSYLINDLKIPKFPIFCSNTQIINFLQNSEIHDYQGLRNKLLVNLLFNYGLSVKDVSKMEFNYFENNTLKVSKNNKVEYIKLKLEDQKLIENYKDYLQKINNYSSIDASGASHSKNYIFAKLQSRSEPMPLQAIWSLLKKLFSENIKQEINHDISNRSFRVDNLDAELLKVDYIKKHPRAQL